MNIQQQFADSAVKILEQDNQVLGLAAAGSWITNELDKFSDLDLVVVTKEKIGGDKEKMLQLAGRLGTLLSGFTGEHVGEPRVLICLYDNPLLHVDIKFVTTQEFEHRIENPIILLDKQELLKEIMEHTMPVYPYSDYQWLEDRFWTWVHYALLKIGRGEYMEAFDFFSYLRMTVLGPLFHIKNGNLPRGVRKVETQLSPDDFDNLFKTVPDYSREGLLKALEHSVVVYRRLRQDLFRDIRQQGLTEEKVMEYFAEIANQRK